MRFCNIVTFAVGVAHGINARPMGPGLDFTEDRNHARPIGTDFDFHEGENHCFARCMNSDRQCRELPGANLSRCASDLATCKPSCSWRMATRDSSLTSTSTSTSTSTGTSTCTGTPTSTASPCTEIRPPAAAVAAPAPSVTADPGVRNSCLDKCQAIHGQCRAGKGADAAKCESNLKACTWLCPLDGLR